MLSTRLCVGVNERNSRVLLASLGEANSANGARRAEGESEACVFIQRVRLGLGIISLSADKRTLTVEGAGFGDEVVILITLFR